MDLLTNLCYPFAQTRQTCWKNNIQCTISHCKFTCLKARLLATPNNIKNETDGTLKLNDCLECDERLCGPKFLECAGANRRRVGIVSDIKRDEEEQCNA